MSYLTILDLWGDGWILADQIWSLRVGHKPAEAGNAGPSFDSQLVVRLHEMNISLGVKSPVTVSSKTAVPCLKYQNDTFCFWMLRCKCAWTRQTPERPTRVAIIGYLYTFFLSGRSNPPFVFSKMWLCCIIDGHSSSCHVQHCCCNVLAHQWCWCNKVKRSLTCKWAARPNSFLIAYLLTTQCASNTDENDSF